MRSERHSQGRCSELCSCTAGSPSKGGGGTGWGPGRKDTGHEVDTGGSEEGLQASVMGPAPTRTSDPLPISLPLSLGELPDCKEPPLPLPGLPAAGVATRWVAPRGAQVGAALQQDWQTQRRAHPPGSSWRWRSDSGSRLLGLSRSAVSWQWRGSSPSGAEAGWWWAPRQPRAGRLPPRSQALHLGRKKILD